MSIIRTGFSGMRRMVTFVRNAILVSALACGLGLVAKPALAQKPAVDAPLSIQITARPIEAFDARDVTRRRFGSLEFRGGLELTSNYRDFGGISGLRITPDGERFIGASDRARWLRGRLDYKEGKPVGIADAEMAHSLTSAVCAAGGW